MEHDLMKQHTEEQFLNWASEHGMLLDEKYLPHVAALVFRDSESFSRFWEVPDSAGARPHMISAFLSLLGSWESCYAWRPMGSWPDCPDEDANDDERVEYQILKGIGMPMASASIVQFSQMDVDQLITLIFSTTLFGWSNGTDLTIVPDHGRFIIKISHHDVFYLFARRMEDLQQFVQAMEQGGYPLPKEVPDSTFKRPDWMEQSE